MDSNTLEERHALKDFKPTEIAFSNLTKCKVVTGMIDDSGLPGPFQKTLDVNIGMGFKCVTVTLTNFQLTTEANPGSTVGLLRNEIFNLSATYDATTGICTVSLNWTRFYNDPQPHTGTVGIAFSILALG